jgi:CheY-like chemotaxis protein
MSQVDRAQDPTAESQSRQPWQPVLQSDQPGPWMPLALKPVLLVEDDPELRLMMATVLEMNGHAVVVAKNGMEAFNLARAYLPSLIILDLMMPVMNGEEFRRAQLANDAIRKIPVVVVSAHHDAQKIARRLNAAGCFTKPLDFDAFSRFVKQRCG